MIIENIFMILCFANCILSFKISYEDEQEAPDQTFTGSTLLIEELPEIQTVVHPTAPSISDYVQTEKLTINSSFKMSPTSSEIIPKNQETSTLSLNSHPEEDVVDYSTTQAPNSTVRYNVDDLPSKVRIKIAAMFAFVLFGLAALMCSYKHWICCTCHRRHGIQYNNLRNIFNLHVSD